MCQCELMKLSGKPRDYGAKGGCSHSASCDLFATFKLLATSTIKLLQDEAASQ